MDNVLLKSPPILWKRRYCLLSFNHIIERFTLAASVILTHTVDTCTRQTGKSGPLPFIHDKEEEALSKQRGY